MAAGERGRAGGANDASVAQQSYVYDAVGNITKMYDINNLPDGDLGTYEWDGTDGTRYRSSCGSPPLFSRRRYANPWNTATMSPASSVTLTVYVPSRGFTDMG